MWSNINILYIGTAQTKCMFHSMKKTMVCHQTGGGLLHAEAPPGHSGWKMKGSLCWWQQREQMEKEQLRWAASEQLWPHFTDSVNCDCVLIQQKSAPKAAHIMLQTSDDTSPYYRFINKGTWVQLQVSEWQKFFSQDASISPFNPEAHFKNTMSHTILVQVTVPT